MSSNAHVSIDLGLLMIGDLVERLVAMHMGSKGKTRFDESVRARFHFCHFLGAHQICLSTSDVRL